MFIIMSSKNVNFIKDFVLFRRYMHTPLRIHIKIILNKKVLIPGLTNLFSLIRVFMRMLIYHFMFATNTIYKLNFSALNCSFSSCPNSICISEKARSINFTLVLSIMVIFSISLSSPKMLDCKCIIIITHKIPDVVRIRK